MLWSWASRNRAPATPNDNNIIVFGPTKSISRCPASLCQNMTCTSDVIYAESAPETDWQKSCVCVWCVRDCCRRRGSLWRSGARVLDAGRRRLLDVSKRKLKRRVGIRCIIIILLSLPCVIPRSGEPRSDQVTVERKRWRGVPARNGVSISVPRSYLQHYDDVIKHSYACSIIKCRRRWVIIITALVKQEVAPRRYTCTTRLLSVSFPLTSSFSLFSLFSPAAVLTFHRRTGVT